MAAIRKADGQDFDAILAVVNDGAQAYRGVIPQDCWHEPYMPASALTGEIESGVDFRVWEKANDILGVMGAQDVKDVTLIRHAYVKTAAQRQGIGTHLLDHLRRLVDKPLLIGTWAAAHWAISFYQAHGFALIARADTGLILNRYWSISARQIETSVVLAEPSWRLSD